VVPTSRGRPIRLWYWRWRLKGLEPEFCLGCGGPLETQTMALCRATAGRVQLTLHGLPFAACANGCRDRRLPQPDFLPRLQAALVDGGQLPIARTQTPSGSISCHRCSSRSWRAGTARAEVRGLVTLQGVSPFAASVTGQVQTCGSCGLQQLTPTDGLRRDLALALARALRAAGLRTRFR
jgi:hypothetical protein